MAGVERPVDPAMLARIARAQRLIDERVAGVSRAATETYESALEKYLPLHLRTFGMTVLGDRSPITEKNLTANERRRLVRSAAMAARPTGPSQGIGGAETYFAEGYNTENPDIQNTFGQFRIAKLPNGEGLVVDKYDFNSSGEPEKPNASLLARIKATAQLAAMASRDRSVNPGNQIPNIAVNGAQRPVNVRLSKDEMSNFYPEAVSRFMASDEPSEDIRLPFEMLSTASPEEKRKRLRELMRLKDSISPELYRSLILQYM